MATMMFGYHYDRGVRVGYDISFPNGRLSFVSSKDKSRIVAELKQAGWSKDEIEVERVTD